MIIFLFFGTREGIDLSKLPKKLAGIEVEEDRNAIRVVTETDDCQSLPTMACPVWGGRLRRVRVVQQMRVRRVMWKKLNRTAHRQADWKGNWDMLTKGLSLSVVDDLGSRP